MEPFSRIIMTIAVGLSAVACARDKGLSHGPSAGNPPAAVESTTYIAVSGPYVARLAEPFEAVVSLNPPANHNVKIEMAHIAGVIYKPQAFELRPGEKKSITVTIQNARWGVVYSTARAPDDTKYQDGWTASVVSFDGHLKPSSTRKLSYETPTTLTLSILDASDKPIPFDAPLNLVIESTDGNLSIGGLDTNRLEWNLNPRSQTSPQFQIRPKSFRGGSVHLNAVLRPAGSDAAVLTQSTFPFEADPAWWLPVVLALIGGLLHGVYNIARSSATAQYRPATLFLASAIAGLVGYLVANLDILGLKLDPSVLRTYPFAGFLCSYFGFDVLFPQKTRTRESATSTPSAPSVAATSAQAATS